MILGLAGKACSGKNAAARFFEEKGYVSLDVDKLGHKALEMRKEEVIASFGSEILDSGGEIDRKALGEIVFKDKNRLRELESITHPAVFEMVESFIAENGERDCIINAAILGTSGLDRLCHKVLWIESPLFLRVLRAFKRDRKKISHIFSRIRAQEDLTSQQFSSGVDIYMVRNRGSLANLKKKIDLFLSEL